MQKIILIIIAMIVNQLASGQDQSETRDQCGLNSVFQSCNEEAADLEMLYRELVVREKVLTPL
ncbi:hypothetical protein DHD32_08015 [Arenibacter sp. TNZ]|jgi:hypothetical protein|uniref:hypothetical protein n=1 Tax=Arenibacter TaxID=178469 RepID=UPI000CD43AE3|nr:MULTISPECIES: hypothetical protein [Arenibacter]MCM4171422.1 hypothetical protein [Arenibacter sp. TNZ]